MRSYERRRQRGAAAAPTSRGRRQKAVADRCWRRDNRELEFREQGGFARLQGTFCAGTGSFHGEARRSRSAASGASSRRTGPTKASGSHLGWLTAERTACRTRSRLWDAPCRLGVRGVPSCCAFSSAPALGSTNSSAGCPASFARFTATMAGPDPSSPCIIGFGSSPSRCGPLTSRAAKVEVSRFPIEEFMYMPGSSTTRDRTCARVDAHPRFAFRCDNGVGVPIDSFAARWLAYTQPCRRFAPGLTADDARLGADVVRYSFIVVDLHHLLLAGLPAHCHRNPVIQKYLPELQ